MRDTDEYHNFYRKRSPSGPKIVLDRSNCILHDNHHAFQIARDARTSYSTVDAPTRNSCKPPTNYHRTLVWQGRAVENIQITSYSQGVLYFGYLRLAYNPSRYASKQDKRQKQPQAGWWQSCPSTCSCPTQSIPDRLLTLAASIGVSGTEDGSAGGISSRTYWSIYAEAVPPLPAAPPI